MPSYDPNGDFDPHDGQRYHSANGQQRRERLPDSYATQPPYIDSRRDSIHPPQYHQSQSGRAYSARPRAFAETTSPQRRQSTLQNVGHPSQQMAQGYQGYNSGNQSWPQPNQSFQSSQPIHQRQFSQYQLPNQPYPSIQSNTSLQAPQTTPTSRPPLSISHAESNEDSSSVERHGEPNANDLQVQGHLSSQGQVAKRGEGLPLNGTYNPQDANTKYEPLDPAYHFRGKDFFQVGRVVAIMMSEPYGATATSYNPCVSVVRYEGNLVYTQVRRFVVVRRLREYCYACPIFTYSGKGTLKSGVQSREHGIAYSFGFHPTRLSNETGVMKASLPVIMAFGEQPLHVASRIYYGIHHPIQYNVKVKDVGQVHPEYLHTLDGNFKSENYGPGTSQSEDTTAAAEVPEDDGSDPDWYHADNYPYGFHPKLCPDSFHREYNPYGYHPKTNVEGHHPQSNPHGFHPKRNPHGYHPKLTPYCYHPTSNPYGYHETKNPTGYHNEANPGGIFPHENNPTYHPLLNQFGYHYRESPDGYHPKYSPYCFHQMFNPYGYHKVHNPTVYHDQHNPHGFFPKQSTVAFALPFHPVENIYGYHYKYNPRGYSPMFAAFFYHPDLNPQGYHSKVNPHGYHDEENVYGFHQTQNPNGFHPNLNPEGHHPEHNPHAFHPTHKPSGYHPSANPFGFDPTHNPGSFQPQYNSNSDPPAYPQAEPDNEMEQLGSAFQGATIQ